MPVTFAIVHWAAIRFTDHVRQGTVATVIRQHLKNESPGTDSWELFGKIISVDSDEEEDGGDDVVDEAVDSGAQREVSANDVRDALSTRSSRPEMLLESQNAGGEAAAGRGPAHTASQIQGACAMEAGEDKICPQPLICQETSGKGEMDEMCEFVPFTKESVRHPSKPRDPLASSIQSKMQVSDETPSSLINEMQQQQGNNKTISGQRITIWQRRSEQVRLFEMITDERTTNLDFFKQLVKVATRPLSGILNDGGVNCAPCLSGNTTGHRFWASFKPRGHWVGR